MRLDLPTDQLVAEIEPPIGWLVFDNPQRHNALTGEMFAALPTVVDRYEADPDVRVIVMRGAGDTAFVSGADIGELSADRGPSESRATTGTPRPGGPDLLGTLAKPLVAMINGYCIGGGLLTALQADLRVAAEHATFAIPAGKLGVGYPYEGTELLVSTVGPGGASRLLLTAERIGADEALAMGLVQQVVPAAELEQTVRALADTIAALAPLSLAAAKRSIRAVCGRDDPAAARQAIADCWASEDFAEGRRAFAERRPPRWQGS
ncbi:MAG: enoyl-CoA hydratase/isomerase family protein [Acidimicrobiales bacterium]|nr:enoyl-CoA hydratase/isomerase family protein [Acidimicrobiales bacterium]